MWVKIDDKFPRNPKVLGGDIETAWYYLCALTHCAEQLTDGYIAESAVPLVAPHITDPQAVAERCVDLDLFRRVPGGFLIPDYVEVNRSRAEVLEEREKARKRQERSRAGRGDGEGSAPPPSRGTSRRDTRRTSDVTSAAQSSPVPESVGTPSSVEGTTARAPAPDDETPEVTAVLDALADAKQPAAGEIRNPTAWRRKVIGNDRTEHGDTIRAAIARWPGAPPTLIAAHVLGQDARNLAHYERPQEIPA